MTDAIRRETGTEEVLCEVRERVAIITLNRPEAKNALTMDMKEALYVLIRDLEDDPEVGAFLLTGAGDAFSAGGDTKRMKKEGKPPVMEDRQRQLRWEHELPRMLHQSSKPSVAAVHGAAAGAACSIALACVVPVEELQAEAFALAAQIASGPPIALRWMKANLNRAQTEDLDTCLRYEADRMVRGALTDDYVEAVAAFSEKRKPDFKGR